MEPNWRGFGGLKEPLRKESPALGFGVGAAVAVIVGVILLAMAGYAHAAAACEHPLADAEKQIASQTDKKPVAYSGLEAARIIGYVYAQPEIPGFPRADSVVTIEGPNDVTLLMLVDGACVSFATEAPTSAWRAQVGKILHGDEPKKPAEQL